ncbi:aminoacyl-tRNA deacylase [Pseudarthrobacter sp. DSP2-3-2b1]|uniref:aminoacyl-tRNA deacylase n=1 Tax=Pseudarthrobacter sp. DSP2-3-2b1 TaxID=2804661 RepID=UPI003CF17E4A
MVGQAGNGSAAVGRQRFLADAAARGLEVQIVERLAAKSLAEAAAILGITPAEIVKSLVVKHKDGTFLFALIPGDRQISWPKLRNLVGVNKLSLPPADVAFEATGYERGTITPLGSTTPWPVYADSTMAGRRISMGAGEHGYSAFVLADALTSALGAVVADISDPA